MDLASAYVLCPLTIIMSCISESYETLLCRSGGIEEEDSVMKGLNWRQKIEGES
jgi:hypothetical protein